MALSYFEYHYLIPLTHKDTIVSVLHLLRTNKQLIHCHQTTTCTSVGVYRHQPMLTFLRRSTSYAEALEWFHDHYQEITQLIPVVRGKIEGIYTPSLDSVVHQHPWLYFEAHTKIRTSLTAVVWGQLVELCQPFGVPLFINYDSTFPCPVTTLRAYRCDFNVFFAEQKKLETVLLAHGFLLEPTQIEYCNFDDYPETDKGWLYDVLPDTVQGLPKNWGITSVTPNMKELPL